MKPDSGSCWCAISTCCTPSASRPCSRSDTAWYWCASGHPGFSSIARLQGAIASSEIERAEIDVCLADRRVGLGQVRIEAARSLRGLERESTALTAVQGSSRTQVDVSIRQTGPRECIAPVAADRLLVVSDRRLEIRNGPTLRVLPAEDVPAIGLDVIGVAFGEPRRATSQLEPQARGDRPGDFFLDFEHLRDTAIAVALAPELVLSAVLMQLHLDDERPVPLHHRAGQDRIDAKIAAQRCGIDSGPSIPKRRRARQDFDLRQLRQAVDDTFRDAVTEIRRRRIGASRAAESRSRDRQESRQPRGSPSSTWQRG